MKQSSELNLFDIKIAGKKMRIPYFDSGVNSNGKTVVVTAGMDGDEYAGIEAAYNLIDLYRSWDFSGRLIVVPIINQPGFAAETSTNPIDGKYPKNIYPGKPHGSASEQLIFQIREKFILGADIWLDLHGGALNEHLTPCVLAYETKNRNSNELTLQILKNIPAELLVYQKKNSWPRTMRIAADGVSYFIFESGTNGSRDKTDVQRHVIWVDSVLVASGLIHNSVDNNFTRLKKIYRELHEILSPAEGLWYPNIISGEEIKKGDSLGTVISTDHSSEKIIRSSHSGIILYGKKGLYIGRHEIAVAYADNPVSLNDFNWG